MKVPDAASIPCSSISLPFCIKETRFFAQLTTLAYVLHLDEKKTPTNLLNPGNQANEYRLFTLIYSTLCALCARSAAFHVTSLWALLRR